MSVMNLFENILYSYLAFKEKLLRKKLEKHLKFSSKNSTSKRIHSSSATVTLSAETKKNAQTALKNAQDIFAAANGEPDKILEFIKSKGTKVVKLHNADKILNIIGEEEGLVTMLEGLEALFLNIVTNSGFSLKSKRMFVLREGSLDPYYMAHQLYKWCAVELKLPGFDYLSQKIFKIYLNSDGSMISNLNLDEMHGLKEAINRDKEATDFALTLVRVKEGGRKVIEKMKTDKGAQI